MPMPLLGMALMMPAIGGAVPLVVGRVGVVVDEVVAGHLRTEVGVGADAGVEDGNHRLGRARRQVPGGREARPGQLPRGRVEERVGGRQRGVGVAVALGEDDAGRRAQLLEGRHGVRDLEDGDAELFDLADALAADGRDQAVLGRAAVEANEDLGRARLTGGGG